MLTIKIPSSDYYDESIGKFISIKECTINLEHSLISIARWESKWNKPFLTKEAMTPEQYRDYLAGMSLTPVNPTVFFGLTPENIEDIKKYIESPMTATTFSNRVNTKINKEVITAEILYYRMIANNIPMECQKWHLNRLFTLLRVCDAKNQPQKSKGNKSAALSRNAQINAARRARLNSKG